MHWLTEPLERPRKSLERVPEPERVARLVRFLEREAPRTAELYILGDLFDYWIGPRHLDRAS